MVAVYMVRQYQQALERPGTNWTLINMCPDMASKVASVVEQLATHVALVYLVFVLHYMLAVQPKIVYS